MTKIFKYPLPLPRHDGDWKRIIEIKAGPYLPLYVGMQRGKLHVWCEVNAEPTCLPRKIVFFVLPTGAEVPGFAMHVGTVQVQNEPFGELVWHVYHLGALPAVPQEGEGQ